MGIERTSGTDTPAKATDKPAATDRHSGPPPDNPGSPGQPSRLESLARARELAREKNGSEKTDDEPVPSPEETTGSKEAPPPEEPEQDEPEPVDEERRTEDTGISADEDAGTVPETSEPTEPETTATDDPADRVSDSAWKDDDLSAWKAAVDQIFGGADVAAPGGKDSPNDSVEKIEVVADRLDIPEDLKASVEYGRPQRTNEDGTRQELPIFDGMPKREDAQQGALGDCGAIAAIGAVAGTVPDKIRDSVRDNNDDTVTVTLHETKFEDQDLAVPTGRVIDVTVSKDIPVFTRSEDEAAFARCTRAGVTWPGYVEKALGAVDETWPPDRGRNPLLDDPRERGYARLDLGTRAWTQAEILTQLTGRPARVHRLDTDPGAVAGNESTLTDLVESGRPCVVSTLPEYMQRADPGAYKLRSQHTYELIGVEDGKVRLRNPYGHKHPDPVPMAEFISFFNSYYACLEREGGGQ